VIRIANGETAIITASNGEDAGAVAVAYGEYVTSMTGAGQTPRPLKDILGK